MKIIIDISEEYYKDIQARDWKNTIWADEVTKAIHEGIVLPEHHGDLPSVNPKSKTGHWVADVDRWGDVITTINGYRCDKCNAFNSDKDNYCPNCGAKMVESQESDHTCHTCKHYASGENDGSCGSYICKGYSNWESEDKE